MLNKKKSLMYQKILSEYLYNLNTKDFQSVTSKAKKPLQKSLVDLVTMTLKTSLLLPPNPQKQNQRSR